MLAIPLLPILSTFGTIRRMNTTFEKETFYRSANCDCEAVVFVDNEEKATIITGSTMVFHRPYNDNVRVENGRVIAPESSSETKQSDWKLIEMLAEGDAIDVVTPGRLEVRHDFTFENMLDATRALIGRDDVVPGDYWEPVFCH